MPHSRYGKKKRAIGALLLFPPREFLPLNPLSLRDIPLPGGMPEPAALLFVIAGHDRQSPTFRLQNPGASGSSHRSSLRHGA